MRLYCGNSPRRRIVAYNLINMPGRVYTTGSTNIIHFRLCLRSSLVSTRQECCNEGGAFPDGISRLEGRLEAEDLQRYLLPESTTAIVQLLWPLATLFYQTPIERPKTRKANLTYSVDDRLLEAWRKCRHTVNIRQIPSSIPNLPGVSR